MSENKDAEAKLLRAISQDEAELRAVMETLTTYSTKRLRIRVHDPADPGQGIEVSGRPLKDFERRLFFERASKIDPKLVSGTVDLKELQLNSNQQEQLTALMDEYISLSTKLPQKFLTELGDDRIRRTLFKGIMQGSSLTKEELAEIEKFRGGSAGSPTR